MPAYGDNGKREKAVYRGKKYKDLKLGQIVYTLVFYNISFSWLPPLDGFQFIFLLRVSENDL